MDKVALDFCIASPLTLYAGHQMRVSGRMLRVSSSVLS